MKRTILLLVCIALSHLSLVAQVSINTDGTLPDGSAALEVKATAKGLLFPRMTTSQREAIAGPAAGLVIFNTNFNCLQFYNGTKWVDLCGNPDVIGDCNGKVFLALDIAADKTPTSYSDTNGYGNEYQWGRLADDHQLIKWNSATSGTPVYGNTMTLSSTDVPGHHFFIFGSSSPNDWRSPQNDNLWQGVNGTSNPCPAGFRLPTKTEWDNALSCWTSLNLQSGFNYMKIVAAGYRPSINGSPVNVGSQANYWSSTTSTTFAYKMSSTTSMAITTTTIRAEGCSIRCIMN